MRKTRAAHGETSIGGQERAFQPTLWTVVLQARGGSRNALDDLCKAYWKPVYFYVRRWGASVEDAKDLTQGFFGEFLRRDFLRDVSREKGRFRNFLLTTLRHYLVTAAERARAQKRGEGKAPLSLDFLRAERDYLAEPAARETLDEYFRRQWALTILESALARLRTELPQDRFEALQSYLSPGDAPSYEATALKLGLDANALKSVLHRIRKRYRELIREEVRSAVETESEVETELRDLFEAL